MWFCGLFWWVGVTARGWLGSCGSLVSLWSCAYDRPTLWFQKLIPQFVCDLLTKSSLLTDYSVPSMNKKFIYSVLGRARISRVITHYSLGLLDPVPMNSMVMIVKVGSQCEDPNGETVLPSDLPLEEELLPSSVQQWAGRRPDVQECVLALHTCSPVVLAPKPSEYARFPNMFGRFLLGCENGVFEVESAFSWCSPCFIHKLRCFGQWETRFPVRSGQEYLPCCFCPNS